MSTANTPELEIGAFEAKNRLSALLDDAASGKRIWITKHGKRVALLSSGLGEVNCASSTLLQRFRTIRERTHPGHATLKELVEDGRQ